MQRTLPGATVESLDAYFDELERWSTRLNLTSIPRDAMWARNVEEVLELLAEAAPAPRSHVLDIGSGGGVPGIVIAILRPDLRVMLLESDRRKCAFLAHIAGLLGLRDVAVEAIRAEEAGRREDLRERFDLVTSRAAAPPAVLCELGLPMLRVGGTLCALVASAAALLDSCAGASAACGGGPPEAPAEGLLRVQKVSPCGARYPRRPGIPARRPIS